MSIKHEHSSKSKGSEKILPSREHLAMFRDIFDGHNWGCDYWVEARNAAKQPAMHRTAPPQNDLATSVHSAKGKTACSKTQ